MDKENKTERISISMLKLIVSVLLLIIIGLLVMNIKTSKVETKENNESTESTKEVSSSMIGNITIASINGKCYLKVRTNIESLGCTSENLPEYIYISEEYNKDNSTPYELLSTSTISKFIYISGKLYIYTKTTYYDDLTEIQSDEVQGIVNKILDRNKWYKINTDKIFIGEIIE